MERLPDRMRISGKENHPDEDMRPSARTGGVATMDRDGVQNHEKDPHL